MRKAIGNHFIKIFSGHKYDCAASFAWVEPAKLAVFVQITDEYFGYLNMVIGFQGEKACIAMKKNGENFLDEYTGFVTAHRKGEQYENISVS